MRYGRLGFILLCFYLAFIGGAGYYTQFLAVRILHHVLMTVVLGVWLLRRIRAERGLPPTALNTWLILLITAWLLSALFSLDPRMGFEHLWIPFTHLLLFFVVADQIQRGKQRLVMETLFLLAAMVVIISGIQVLMAFLGLGIIRPPGQGWINFLGTGVPLPLDDIRIWLPLGVTTWVAGFVAPLITVAIAWALTVRVRSQRVVLWGLAGMLAIVLLLTRSRGGILSVLLALGAFVLMQMVQSERGRRLLARRAVPLVGTAGVIVALTVVIITAIGAEPGRQSGDAVRMDLWRSAVSMTGDYPLFGVGPGLYGRGLRLYRDPELARDRLSTAHNIYLHTAAETGLVSIAVGVALLLALLRAWWRLRAASAAGSGRRLRLEGVGAALLGLALHSIFDTLNSTANVLVLIFLVAYCIIPLPTSQLEPAPRSPRLTALATLALLLGFGVWLLVMDAAQANFQTSLNGGETALNSAETAAAIDPGLHLYPLQIAVLTGVQAWDSDPDLPAAIAAYERALALEPTWDTGWINLAALRERAGDLPGALAALDTARGISYANAAHLHWARIADTTGTASDEAIISAYIAGIYNTGRPPLAGFWLETDLRRRALQQYMAGIPLDSHYRVASVQFPDTVQQLVPVNPQTAPEWWVVGEYALTVEGDAARAAVSFTEAIRLNPGFGDYYAARARALRLIDPEAAARDLNTARFLGTLYEYPNATAALMTNDPEQVVQLRARALPARILDQNFEGVLFGGRRAAFDLLPAMRVPGPGRLVMQPWYELAAMYEVNGDAEQALVVYRAIVEYAPDEDEARQQITRLGG